MSLDLHTHDPADDAADDGADLRELIGRAVEDLTAPAGLYREAVSGAARLRRRRRLASAATGLVAAAAVAAIVVPLTGGGAATTGQPVDTPPESSPPSSGIPSAVAESSPAPFVPHPGWWDMPVEPMRERLEALLPQGVTVTDHQRRNTDHAPGESPAHRGVLRATLAADGDGPGSFEMMLLELPRDRAALAQTLRADLACDLSGWDFQDLEGEVHCDTSTPDQRSLSFTDQGVTYLELRRRVGQGEIYVAVANSTERKWGPPASADQPPLTLNDLERIVAADVWADWSPKRR